MGNYTTEFRRLVLATVSSFALFVGLVVAVVFVAALTGSDGGGGNRLLGFTMAMLPLLALFPVFHAHERFLRNIDEYLRSLHEQAFRTATYFEILFLGFYAMSAVTSGFAPDPTGMAVTMVLLSMPLFMFYYLFTARLAVRQDAQPDREA